MGLLMLLVDHCRRRRISLGGGSLLRTFNVRRTCKVANHPLCSLDIKNIRKSMLQAMKEQDERGDSVASHRNQDIYKAKLQVNDIHAMKRALDEYSNSVFKQLLEKQEDRIRGLFDSTSPLCCHSTSRFVCDT